MRTTLARAIEAHDEAEAATATELLKRLEVVVQRGVARAFKK